MANNKTISPTICAVPWTHLNIEPDGKVIPCCLTSPHKYYSGDVQTESIETIWNSEPQRRLRRQMMQGEEPSICATCFDRERLTGESGRIYKNKHFQDVIARIPEITDAEGYTPVNLLYWDFRFSNLCNFKCRSCGPRYSSAWIPDAKALWGVPEDKAAQKVWSIQAVHDRSNLDMITDHIDTVRRIYFAGGEPLLHDEHWAILRLLRERQRQNSVVVNYNTNLSMLEYHGESVLDYWREYPMNHLDIWPSLDEIGARAELIRSGTSWNTIVRHLEQVCALENAIVRPGITVGAWNVQRLPEIITELVRLKVIRHYPGQGKHLHYNNFFLNMITYPSYYHVHVLPDAVKDATRHKLRAFIETYNAQYDCRIESLFEQVLGELQKPFDLSDARKFVDMTAKMDALRQEDLYQVIPEMECVRASVRAMDSDLGDDRVV